MLEKARDLIAQAARPVSFSGAGLSAESGIATFRDPEGVWAKVDPQQMATPEGFEADPELVIGWYTSRRQGGSAAQPNAAHRALATDSRFVHITQNIDGLLEAAGATNVLHLHGVIDRDRCHEQCGHSGPAQPGLYRCPKCGAFMRPDVVWFGEMLPQAVWAAAEDAAIGADVMLVVGTSAMVYPAAGLIEVAANTGATVIVANAEPLGLGGIELIGPAAEVLPRLLGD